MNSETTPDLHPQKIIGLLKRIPRWAKILTIILIVFLAAVPLVNRGKNSALPVTTLKTSLQDLDRTIFTSGRLEPVTEQEFFTPEDSTLMELNVKVGDRVKKGDILGRLDTLELARLYENALANKAAKEAELVKAEAQNDELTLKSVEATYNLAKNKAERMKSLYEAGANSKEDLENALAEEARAYAEYQETLNRTLKGAGEKERVSLQKQVDLAAQEVAQAKERLDMATFVVQEDGVVTFIGAQEGNRVLEGSHLITIGNDQQLEVTANINEIDAGSIVPGQAVKITCMAWPGLEFSGEVAKVGAAAVSQTTNSGENISVPVTVKLAGNTEDLRIGYTVDLTIKTMSEKDVIALPMEAIINRDDKKLVFVIENGLAKEREITSKIGNELNDIVLTGLAADEEIILNPPADLQDGQKVQALLGQEKKA